ncbi:MAG TPA: N-6 DNA methylase, partial [Syntrophomonadaceae bacterium]|nr:N-6 DNA methylase [Syntrophomonadaceae bacterium]
EGRVFDPCCGSGGMFVQSEKFIRAHNDRYKNGNGKGLPINPADRISIYGQESNQTTWRLCKMNLAIRGIDSSNIKWNNEGSFLNDAHKDLKADFVIANPPFNDSDWGGEHLRNDGRWVYGVPPVGNANYAWIQHFIYHLAPKGTAGFVLAKGALSSKTNNEGEIRKNIIEARLVDCIVNLPSKLFLNTQIPASLWFLSRAKANGRYRNRRDEILFIDARDMGTMINRRTRELTQEDIRLIADTYHNWRNIDGNYKDIPGFCKSATIDEVTALDYVLTPGRYVGLPEEDDNFDFEERIKTLSQELRDQMDEAQRLDKAIVENLRKIGIEI